MLNLSLIFQLCAVNIPFIHSFRGPKLYTSFFFFFFFCEGWGKGKGRGGKVERGTSFCRDDDDGGDGGDDDGDDDGRLKRLSYGVVYGESDECTGVY